jgi:hypothetical protein
MAFPQYGPNSPGGLPPLPPLPKGPFGNQSSKLGSNPGLLTSTGGLFGVNGVLLTPVFNNTTKKSYILLMDPTNFNCEEPAEYDFPQVKPSLDAPQEGRDVSCHMLILEYRELGYATLTINVTTFEQNTDSFTSYPYQVSIPPKPLKGKRKSNFPDGRIHTLRIPINVPGERPQPTINSNGGSGAYSIISLVLCGNADETPQM